MEHIDTQDTQSDSTIRAMAEVEKLNASRQAPEWWKRSWLPNIAVLLAGFIIFFPALRAPFLLDDYVHASMVDGSFPAKRGIFDLYNFVTDADRTVLTERGMITWWADPHLQIRFFRPLASALRWGEHILLGRNSFLLHLHSFCWWFVTVLGARALFQRALSPRATLFATFIFALAPCHVMPLAWLANREAFMSLAFGTFALNAYFQYRDTRRVAQALVATVLFALALLSGEYALCLAGFVLAAEFVRRNESALRRALGLVPFVAPTLAYLAVRTWLGYGPRGSGYYTDPVQEPVRFLSVAPRRFTTLLANGWMSLDYDTFDATTPYWMIAGMAILCTPLLFIALRQLFVRLDEPDRRWFWIFGVGSSIALVPVMAVSPTPRVVGVSVLGIAPLVAMMLEKAWFVPDETPNQRTVFKQLAYWATTLLAFAHLVHTPGAAWLSASRIREHAQEFVDHAASLRARMVVPEQSQVIVVRAVINSFYMPFVLDPEGRLPVYWRILTQTSHALVLRRGPRTLEIIVRPEDRIYSSGPDHLFRQDPKGLREGDVISMPGIRVTILAVGPVGPRRVLYEFEHDLESSAYTWLAENTDGFVVEKPLPIGFGKPYDL